MASSVGGKSVADPSTLKGRAWPCLRQFCVVTENRVGSLHDLLRRIEDQEVNVVGLSTVDTIDFTLVRLIVNKYERGKDRLDLSQYPYTECDVIGVLFPDSPQPYLEICQALVQAELNIHYTYPLLFRQEGRRAIAVRVDDLDLGLQTLGQEGLDIVTESDLLNDDYF